MREPTIVRSWDSLPPVVSYGGEEFSTRVLEKNYRDTKKVALALLGYIDALPEDVVASLPAMPGINRDHVEKVLQIFTDEISED